MKKILILTIAFILIMVLSTIALSYLGGMGIKLSTVESPNPRLTYFVENIRHQVGFKFLISIFISTVFTTAIYFIFSYTKPKSKNIT